MQCSACTVVMYGFTAIPLVGMAADYFHRKELIERSERFVQRPTMQNLPEYNSALLRERNYCMIALARDALSIIALVTLMALSILTPAAAIGMLVVLVLSFCFNAETLSRVLPLQKKVDCQLGH